MKTTLETSGEDVKLQSKRVEKIGILDDLPPACCVISLGFNLSGGLGIEGKSDLLTMNNKEEQVHLHSKRVEKM